MEIIRRSDKHAPRNCFIHVCDPFISFIPCFWTLIRLLETDVHPTAWITKRTNVHPTNTLVCAAFSPNPSPPNNPHSSPSTEIVQHFSAIRTACPHQNCPPGYLDTSRRAPLNKLLRTGPTCPAPPHPNLPKTARSSVQHGAAMMGGRSWIRFKLPHISNSTRSIVFSLVTRPLS